MSDDIHLDFHVFVRHPSSTSYKCSLSLHNHLSLLRNKNEIFYIYLSEIVATLCSKQYCFWSLLLLLFLFLCFALGPNCYPHSFQKQKMPAELGQLLTNTGHESYPSKPLTFSTQTIDPLLMGTLRKYINIPTFRRSE